MKQTIGRLFEQRTEDIETIFSSYRELYNIYASILRTANVNQNALIAFEKAKISADRQQKQISNRLYSQGFVLLSGAAEALLKDTFECLLVENFTAIRGVKGINFSVDELQRSFIGATGSEHPLGMMSHELGVLTVKKTFQGRNPSERINFQNIKSTKDALNQYFGIKLDEGDVFDRIHRYWQIRHCLIHTNSRIDERFVNNVSKVKLLKSDEKVGDIVNINKSDFIQAKKDFVDLFDKIDGAIKQKGLHCEFLELIGSSYSK